MKKLLLIMLCLVTTGSCLARFPGSAPAQELPTISPSEHSHGMGRITGVQNFTMSNGNQVITLHLDNGTSSTIIYNPVTGNSIISPNPTTAPGLFSSAPTTRTTSPASTMPPNIFSPLIATTSQESLPR